MLAHICMAVGGFVLIGIALIIVFFVIPEMIMISLAERFVHDFDYSRLDDSDLERLMFRLEAERNKR